MASHHVDTDPDASILLSIEVYLSLLVLGFVAFELLRPRLLVYFNCRGTDPKASCPLAEQVYGFGGWIAPVLRATDDEIMEFCGLDALCYLRFLRLGRNIAGASILLSFGLMPIYASAIRPDGESLNETTAQDMVARLAMANMNVSLDPNRLWAPVAAGFLITIYTLRLLVAEYKVYVSRRHEFLGRDGLQQYTVIMNDLPQQLRTHEALTKYLHKLFPTMVDSVHMAMECRELEAQVAKRERVRGDLERAMVTAVQTGHRPTTSFKRGQVDAIDHWSQLLEKLNISIRTEIETLRGYQAKLHEVMNEESLEDALCNDHDDEYKAPENNDAIPIATMLSFMRPSAFVTFNTLQATQSALQMLQTDTPSEMLVRPAPDPADILWDNLGRTLNSLSSWQLVSTLATLVILVLWSVPTVFVTTLASMDQWRDQYTSVDQTLHDHPWLVDFCKQMAPLGLVALSGLAPYIFGALSKREGLASQTEVDASTFSKLVSFQFVQTFVVALLSGSLNSLLPVLIDSPYLFVTIFSEALSLQASLYISIMTILTGLVLPCKLFRVGSFLRGFLYYCFAPRLTPRERRSPWKWLSPMSAIETCSQSTILPSYFLVLLLVLVFCPMTPLIGYFGGLLFLSRTWSTAGSSSSSTHPVGSRRASTGPPCTSASSVPCTWHSSF
ncbi:hypothetical protein SPRG_15853 [Saprolegnia parasitica CBS 223.65]|uniref:CSC1/OSCA1-like 7TM region domain-containing protein n=1 Tax=Saprolegnia parasitica (strain CBS 223.65) TaxID=695850 RepID=A0A067BK70_SAPPC|nr:hypothetical protein SPRG_15853 [Saprolegnia parasitica CBS 223.65]KDO18854.1 hypothetical protein SPRG_15853 [Saprolegnia parasitica CBS 223.65]|eukprot:XP_012210437.1 hypothetical protein SPRG_15853 [Saprolegnia parasitica CBS 223.65]